MADYDWGKIIDAATQVAGKYAAGSAAGRATEAGLNNSQDALKGSQYNTAQNAQMQAGNLDLSRNQFSEQARGNRTKQAMLGDLLANFKPTSISTPGIQNATISGGLSDSMGLMGKAAGSELSRQALLKLMSGDQFTGGEILPQPGVTAQPKAGLLEKIMAGIGTGGAIAGAIGSGINSNGDDSENASSGSGGGSASSGVTPGGTSWSDLQAIMKRLQTQQDGGQG